MLFAGSILTLACTSFDVTFFFFCKLPSARKIALYKSDDDDDVDNDNEDHRKTEKSARDIKTEKNPDVCVLIDL